MVANQSRLYIRSDDIRMRCIFRLLFPIPSRMPRRHCQGWWTGCKEGYSWSKSKDDFAFCSCTHTHPRVHRAVVTWRIASGLPSLMSVTSCCRKYSDSLKGTVSWGFWRHIFSWLNFPRTSLIVQTEPFHIFFENSRRYSQLRVQHQWNVWQMGKMFETECSSIICLDSIG